MMMIKQLAWIYHKISFAFNVAAIVYWINCDGICVLIIIFSIDGDGSNYDGHYSSKYHY